VFARAQQQQQHQQQSTRTTTIPNTTTTITNTTTTITTTTTTTTTTTATTTTGAERTTTNNEQQQGLFTHIKASTFATSAARMCAFTWQVASDAIVMAFQTCTGLEDDTTAAFECIMCLNRRRRRSQCATEVDCNRNAFWRPPTFRWTLQGTLKLLNQNCLPSSKNSST
jgi:aldehyde:ferredoxin oxidoreductase